MSEIVEGRNASELGALIRLLDDPDREVFRVVRDRLLQQGAEVILPLENAWQFSEDQLVQERIEDIVHVLQLERSTHDLREWMRAGAKDLLQGMLAVARFQYPALDEALIRNQLFTLKSDAWRDMTYAHSALDKVRTLNHVFFHVHHFSGNAQKFNDPQNSYLNVVMETKRGNPLSLSVVYSIVARLLDMPVFGVNLPQHFVLAYLDDSEEARQLPMQERKVLFYINPFNKGMIFTEREISQFLKLLKLEESPKYYMPCSNLDIIKRVLNNLQAAYEEQERQEKVREVEILRSIVNGTQ